jgi:redox-sensitive bicupin YhaK (pirin superfamily)
LANTRSIFFCVYHQDNFPKGNGKFGPQASLAGRNIGQDFNSVDGWNMYHGETVPGFPAHPHRGFETITIVNEGVVDHADSLSAAGRYGGGDTQWMTAGKDTPVVECVDVNGKLSTVKIIAGELNGHRSASPPPESWANNLENAGWVWNIKMPAKVQFTLPASSAYLNRVLYFYARQVATLETTLIRTQQGVQLISDADVILNSGEHACEFLLLQGRPIAEPVARYGPFVMNTEQEIQQAFSDYRKDQFGGWPWTSSSPVHFNAKARFAKHADGKLEEPNS